MWKIHPDYPEFAFAENGDVIDKTQIPPKMLNVYESKDSKSGKPYMRVDIRNKKGDRTSISVANHMVNLFGLRSWEHAQHFSFRYKDGDFRNIHISNLEVYKRHPEYRILFDNDIKEIEALLEENKLSHIDIAKKYEVTKDTILKISKNLSRRRKRAETIANKDKRAAVERTWKNAPAEIKEILKSFKISDAAPGWQRNRSFTWRLVNERLSNYTVRGMVERKNFSRTAPATKSEVEDQVKMLNDYFFG